MKICFSYFEGESGSRKKQDVKKRGHRETQTVMFIHFGIFHIFPRRRLSFSYSQKMTQDIQQGTFDVKTVIQFLQEKKETFVLLQEKTKTIRRSKRYAKACRIIRAINTLLECKTHCFTEEEKKQWIISFWPKNQPELTLDKGSKKKRKHSK